MMIGRWNNISTLRWDVFSQLPGPLKDMETKYSSSNLKV